MMLDRKTRPIWHLLVSWVLIVLMIASVGEVAIWSFGGALAVQDDLDTVFFDEDDLDIFDDDTNGNDDDPINDGNGNGNGDDPNVDDNIERYIRFEPGRSPVEIENITTIDNPWAFLLHGVRALDEGGNNIPVTIECHGNSLLYNGRFNLDRLLPGAYFTVVYRAVHPVTDEVFTASRMFYISAEVVHTLRFYFAEGTRGVSLENIHNISFPMQFLHEGVTVLDENNVSIEFTITDFDRILFAENGRYHFNLELMQPGEVFTPVYSAIHPTTGDIFYATRRFYVSAAMMTHSVTFDVDEYHVTIENIHEIENPMDFLLTGIRAVDENNEELTIEIIDTDGLLIDGANIVEIDGERVFMNKDTELPSEDGTMSTGEDAYREDSEFNLEEIEHHDEFVVTFMAVHPEDPSVYETVERVFVVALGDIIHITGSQNRTISNGQIGIISSNATGINAVTGVVTVENGGTLIMHGGVIQGPNVAIPAARVIVNDGGSFYMTGGVIRGVGTAQTAANVGTFGVRVNAGGTFVMGECYEYCPACNPTDPPASGVEIPPIIETPPRIVGHNADTRPAVWVAGGTFEMHEGSIHLTMNNSARGVRIDNNGTFYMYGGIIRNIANPLPVPAIRDTGNDRGFGVDMRGGVFFMTDGEIYNTSTAVNMSNSAIFYLVNGEIRYNATNQTRSPGVNITSGTFNMSGGEIHSNTHTWAANTNDGGVGVRLDGAASSFNMSAGTIRDNIHLAGIGGGVHVRGGATFNLSGTGEISGNTAGRNSIGTGESGGGGVAVLSSRFTMSGGNISGNRTRTSGGGVSVRGPNATFTMNGGTIYDNEATNTRTGRGIGGAGYYSGGGGVWVYGSGATFEMVGGTIHHNRTGGFWNSWRGGTAITHEADVPPSSDRTSSAGWISESASVPAAGAGGQNQNGGGVFVLRNAHFTMRGGTISHNVAGDLLQFWRGDWNLLPRGGTYHGGGGIATRNEGRVNITGGRIAHNRSPAGGGIYVDNWAQASIEGATIEYNVAYGRIFTNLLGWDGRGGGGIAIGDGLYYGGLNTATPVSGDPPFERTGSGHSGTAVCILGGTIIRHNISGGDGGGIYWWASSAVRMDDERYLHGLRVHHSVIVENNLAYAGAPANFNELGGDSDDRLWTVYGRMDDGLNNRHNITPRRRVATSVIRNGRVNPGGMWISEAMASNTRYTRQYPPGTNVYFAGPGHHAFNNHDIRTVGGYRWTRPQPDVQVPEPEPPMQDISQGRVQLELVGSGGAPVQGSDPSMFPEVDMGNIEVELRFNRVNAPRLPLNLPPTGNSYQRDIFRRIQEGDHFPGFEEPHRFPTRGGDLDPIIINEESGKESGKWSDAIQVYNVLPHGFDSDSNIFIDDNGNEVFPRTYHGTNVQLIIRHTNDERTHRVTKIEVFGTCGCRVHDHLWLNVVRPDGSQEIPWENEVDAPSGWAPGPYLLNHFCLTHDITHNDGQGALLGDRNLYVDYEPRLPYNLLPNPIRDDIAWPSPGDAFYHGSCLACRDEHPTIARDSNPLMHPTYFSFIHTLDFFEVGEPYPFRPGAGFGAYGLIFRVTIEPIPMAYDNLRLGVIGGSIDFGTHDILDVLTRGDRVIRLGGYRDLLDDYGEPVIDVETGDPVQVLNGSNPAELGFTVLDSRPRAERESGWHVKVQADDEGIFNSMLRLDDGCEEPNLGLRIGGAAAVILDHTDARHLTVCCAGVLENCDCPTRVTRVTWVDLIDMNRDIVVCMNLNYTRIPPAELHRAVLTWTVVPGMPDDRTGESIGTTGTLQQRRIHANETNTPTATEEQNTRTLAENNPPMFLIPEFDTPRRKRATVKFKLKLKPV